MVIKGLFYDTLAPTTIVVGIREIHEADPPTESRGRRCGTQKRRLHDLDPIEPRRRGQLRESLLRKPMAIFHREWATLESRTIVVDTTT